METNKINELKGLYTFKSPYHEDKRDLPFEVVGMSFNKNFPLEVKTVEYRGYDESKVETSYKIETVEDFIKTGFLTKVKAPNLNPLFIDQIVNFAHLVNVKPQTKNDFLLNIAKTYDLRNPKNKLFFEATRKSEFESIRLSDNRTSVLFNH